jgi:hypothetical protein
MEQNTEVQSISARLEKIKQDFPKAETILVAVSKTKPESDILEAYDAGHRHFGENKVQELAAKYEALPKDIAWHMIGHLQRNKVKYIAPFVWLIHGVDSVRLLKEIDKQAARAGRIIPCLLQVHIAQEESKFGFDPDEVNKLFEEKVTEQYPHVQISGLMGMATFTENEEQIRAEFMELKALFDQISKSNLVDKSVFRYLSMGMSNDYNLALELGSNMVRIGSLIFGPRN